MDYSFAVEIAQVGERLDKFLASKLTHVSRSKLQRWIDLGAVTVDEAAREPKYRLRIDDQILVSEVPDEQTSAFLPEDLPLEVIAKTNEYWVIHKAVGMVTHPAPGNWTGTVLNALLHQNPHFASLPRAGIVHRLDKDTSGLMVVAASSNAMLRLTEQLATRTMGRRYFAIVHGAPADRGTVNQPIGRDPKSRVKMAVVADGKPARTHWQVLARSAVNRASFALLECRLESGRTHQIRVHLQSVGFPLLADAVYGRAQSVVDHLPGMIERQALHAWHLSFSDPAQMDQTVRFQANPPADFVQCCLALGLADPSVLMLELSARLGKDLNDD